MIKKIPLFFLFTMLIGCDQKQEAPKAESPPLPIKSTLPATPSYLIVEDNDGKWYTVNRAPFTGARYQCKNHEGNPGETVAILKEKWPKMHFEEEYKQGDLIVAVKVVIPEQNSFISYVRGEIRCDQVIQKLNNEIEALENKLDNEKKNLSDKYK